MRNQIAAVFIGRDDDADVVVLQLARRAQKDQIARLTFIPADRLRMRPLVAGAVADGVQHAGVSRCVDEHPADKSAAIKAKILGDLHRITVRRLISIAPGVVPAKAVILAAKHIGNLADQRERGLNHLFAIDIDVLRQGIYQCLKTLRRRFRKRVVSRHGSKRPLKLRLHELI